jgi:cytoskeleton protein RodZ
VFEGFLNAGDRQTWQAKRSLTVRVGNAAAVNIALNGKPLGPLGSSGQVYEHTFSSGAPSP